VHEAAGDAADEERVVDAELDRLVQLRVAIREHLVELLRLRDGAREAVEHKAALARRLVEVLADQVHDEVVRHELAGVHDVLGLLAERRLRLHGGAEHVARREVAHAVLLDELGRLRALARAGRAHEHHADAGLRGRGRRRSVRLVRHGGCLPCRGHSRRRGRASGVAAGPQGPRGAVRVLSDGATVVLPTMGILGCLASAFSNMRPPPHAPSRRACMTCARPPAAVPDACTAGVAPRRRPRPCPRRASRARTRMARGPIRPPSAAALGPCVRGRHRSGMPACATGGLPLNTVQSAPSPVARLPSRARRPSSPARPRGSGLRGPLPNARGHRSPPRSPTDAAHTSPAEPANRRGRGRPPRSLPAWRPRARRRRSRAACRTAAGAARRRPARRTRATPLARAGWRSPVKAAGRGICRSARPAPARQLLRPQPVSERRGSAPLRLPPP